MALVRNPKTGQVIILDEEFDVETGEDVSRAAALAKGYQPVQMVLSPDLKKQFTIDDTAESIEAALEKGWKLPHQVVKGVEGTGLVSGKVSRDEVQQLANQYQIPFEKLDANLEFIGAYPDYRDVNEVKAAFSLAGRSVGMGIPQFLYREAQDANVQQAFSDLQELARERRSTLETGAEIVGSFAVPGTGVLKAGMKGAQAAKVLGAGSAVGAAAGLGGSKEGEELSDALIGASLGAAFAAVPALFSKGKKLLPEETDEIVKRIEKAEGKNLDELILADREKNMEVILARKEALIDKEVTEDTLLAAGKWAAQKESVQRSLRTVGIDVAEGGEELLKELGSVDLDYAAIELAKELGSRTEGVSFDSIAAGTKKASAVISKAKQFIESKRALPGGAEEVEMAFNRMIDKSAARGLVSKMDVDAESFIPLRTVAESIIDGKYVSRGIDRRNGTNMERVIMDMDSKTNQLTYILNYERNNIARLAKEAKGAGLDLKNFRQYVELPEVKARLNPAQRTVVGKVQNYFEELRQGVAELGFEIPARENYFPHQTPTTFERIRRIRDRVAAFNTKHGVNLLEEGGEDALAKLQQEDEELLQAFELFGKRKIETAEDLRAAARESTTVGDRIPENEMTEATAAFLREDKVPEFLLLNSFEGAALNWVQDTFRHALLRKELAELQRIRDVVQIAKDERGASYITRLLNDITGLRVGSVASQAKKVVTTYRVKMDEAVRKVEGDGLGNQVATKTLEFFRDAPEAWNTMLSMAYPNFLGLSPRAMLMNLTQIPTMTIPELGGKLGTKYSLVAMGDLAKTMFVGERVVLKNPAIAKRLGKSVGEVVFVRGNPLLSLQNEGLIAKQYTQELVDALQGDIKRSLPVEVFKRVSDRYSRVAMGMFSATEVLNRTLTASMGKQLASDLLSRNRDAMEWLMRVKGAQGRAMLRLMQEGKEEALTLLVQEYLVSKTVLNYTRQSMSEFGRFMGPAFSMFTKWPSTVSGEIIEQYASNTFKDATVEVARRYLFPWAVLASLGAGLTMHAEDNDYEGTLKAFTGSRGLPNWAPLTSVEAIIGGEFLKSPAADIASTFGNLLMNPSVAGVDRAMNDAAMTFLPFISVMRLFEQDLPRMMNEDTERFKPVQTAGKWAAGAAGLAAGAVGAGIEAMQDESEEEVESLDALPPEPLEVDEPLPNAEPEPEAEQQVKTPTEPRNLNVGQFLKFSEGFKPTPYWDRKQYSWGYGTRVPGLPTSGKVLEEGPASEEQIRKVGSITREQAAEEKRKYIQEAERAVDSYGLNLAPHERAALLDHYFNAGPKWLNTLLEERVKRLGDTSALRKEVANALWQYRKSGSEVLPGLAIRATIRQLLWEGVLTEGATPEEIEAAIKESVSTLFSTGSENRLKGLESEKQQTTLMERAITASKELLGE